MAPNEPLARTQQAPSLPRAVLVGLSRAVFLAVLPDGGQGVARRNAWAGMSANSARGRHQREADLAIDAARTRANARTQLFG